LSKGSVPKHRPSIVVQECFAAKCLPWWKWWMGLWLSNSQILHNRTSVGASRAAKTKKISFTLAPIVLIVRLIMSMDD